MRLLLSILCSLLFCLGAKAQLDSTVQASLRGKLDEYAKAMCTESIETQCEETDFLISASNDSLIRQFTATHLLEYYTDCKLMVASNIMVHIYDNWFANGKVKFNDEMQEMASKFVVELKRQNLIGCKAPELKLRDSHNQEVSFSPEGELALTVFYADDCSRCRLEIPALCHMLDRKDCDIHFYAIYTKDDPIAWKKFREEKFDLHSEKVKISHLWDPENISDMSRRYGVIQTPKIFITDKNGIIIGRELDFRAAEDILSLQMRGNELNYGSEDAMNFFDQALGEEEDLKQMVDYVATSSFKKAGERMFRQMTGDLLYWLSSKHKEPHIEAADYLIDKYVTSPEHSSAWANADDSLKIVGLAAMLKDQHSKAAVGSRVVPLKVKGEYLSGTSKKTKTWRLDRLPKKHSFIIFHTESCNDCKNEIKAAKNLILSDPESRILTVSVREAESTMQEEDFAAMLDAFDLSSLPYIIELDKNGKIVGRYLSFLNK